MLQHRHVIAHQGLGVTHEGRQDDDQGPQAGEHQGGPGQPGPARALVETPQDAAEGQAPDQHRQVYVHHQRRVKKIDPGNVLGQVGRARHHQQHREHTRAQQRQHAEPQPAQGQLAPGIARHIQAVVLFRSHSSLNPSLKLATSTCAGCNATSASSSQG